MEKYKHKDGFGAQNAADINKILKPTIILKIFIYLRRSSFKNLKTYIYFKKKKSTFNKNYI